MTKQSTVPTWGMPTRNTQFMLDQGGNKVNKDPYTLNTPLNYSSGVSGRYDETAGGWKSFRNTE